MKIIGHRGARGLAPENTIASVKKAIEVGVDEVEIDVRVTKDQQIVVVHDSTIADKKGNLYNVAEHAYETLLKIKPDLPLLRDVVEAVNHSVPLLIEVKPKVNTVPIIAYFEHLLATGWQPKDFLLCSFSQRTLRVLHQALPSIELVVISNFSSINARRRARQIKTKRISMNHRFLWSGFIKMMHHEGYLLGVFSLNNPHKAERWRRLGLNAVITDRPDLFIVDR